MSNRPRDGNIPVFHRPHNEQDAPDTLRPMRDKIDSGLAEPKRDTMRNRDLARRQGWTEDDWERWISFGLAPGQKPPEAEVEIKKSTTTIVTDEIDERVGKRIRAREEDDR